MLKKTAFFVLALLIAIQFISVEKTNPEVDTALALHAPDEIELILKKACYDCHSHETTWPSYASVAPFSFYIASHVNDGRRALNFSLWKEIDPKIKEQRVKRAIQTINNGMMALPSYVFAHEDAKLTKDEKKVLTDWLRSLPSFTLNLD